jgi:hypothetical protein
MTLTSSAFPQPILDNKKKLMDPLKKTTQIFNSEESIHSSNNDMIEEAIAQNDGEDRSELEDIFNDLGI